MALFITFSQKIFSHKFRQVFFIVMYLKHHTKSSFSDQNFAVKSGSKKFRASYHFSLAQKQVNPVLQQTLLTDYFAAISCFLFFLSG